MSAEPLLGGPPDAPSTAGLRFAAWVASPRGNRAIELALDLSVGLKSLVASVCVILLLSPSTRMTYEDQDLQYEVAGGEVVQASVAGAWIANHACYPELSYGSAMDVFLCMIVINQLLFITGMVLKRVRPRALEARRMQVAYALAMACGSIAACKIVLVTYLLTKDPTYSCGSATQATCFDRSVVFNVTSQLDSACTEDCALEVSCGDVVTTALPYDVYVLMVSFLLSALYSTTMFTQFGTGEKGAGSGVLATVQLPLPRYAEALGGRLERLRPACSSDAVRLLTVFYEHQVLLERARTRWQRVKGHVARDVAALVKFALSASTLLLTLSLGSEMIECDEIVVDDEGFVVVSSSDIEDGCGAEISADGTFFALCSVSLYAFLVFVVWLVIEKGLYLKRYAGAVAVSYVGLVLALFALLFGLVGSYNGDSLWFGCQQTVGDVYSEGLCRQANFTIADLGEPIAVDCATQCYVTVPTVVYYLAVNIVLAGVYMLVLAASYYTCVKASMVWDRR